MELYQNTYVKILLDNVHRIIEMAWSAQAPEMEDEDFKQIFLTYAALTEQYNPMALLVHNQSVPYVVRPHLQEWLDQNITPRTIQAGLNFVAIVVVGNDILAKVASELLMQEPNTRKLQTRFFDDVAVARKWLIVQTGLLLKK
ncbi:MAG: hypothetical protein RMJ87_00490 [Cytophagales bacterium]|nr:hypothetical protein [Bernardetiaceae bacterium]MDW8203478.1 hypothetical protein [Cytophagales bacterium]